MYIVHMVTYLSINSDSYWRAPDLHAYNIYTNIKN